MKYYEDGEWKDVQVKVANAIQNEYGESNNDGYSQNYLNDKVVNVGIEVDSRSRVNVLKSNNLLNFVDGTYTDLNVVRTISNGEITLNGTPLNINYNDTIITFKATKSGIYTLTPNKSETNSEIRFIYQVNNGSFVNSDITPQISLSIGDILTINLRISTTNTLSNFKLKPMLNYGNEATTYEPYIIPSINVDGEEIYSKDNLEQYSTSEIRIGTWIDGKPLYRRTFITTNFSSSNDTIISLSGMNINIPVRIYGMYRSTIGNSYPMPLTDSSQNYSVLFFTATTVRGRVVQGDGGTCSTAYITIEYTKTTD